MKKSKYKGWLFLLIPVFIILIIFLLHFNYLYSSTSEKDTRSFFSNLGIAFVDLKNIVYNQLSVCSVDFNLIDIPVFELFVRENKIDKLNSQLPRADYFGITHVSRDYVAGDLVYGNLTYSSRVRYRGDNFFHWRFPKKSWRVKLSDKKIFDGSNKFNFINPKFDSHMNTQLSYYMADRMDLISPRSYYVAVFLNNLYNGVYYYTDQIDETFLRMKNKLPGDLYYGEIGDDFNFLFDGSDYWNVVSTKDGNLDRAKKELDFFLKNVNEKDFSDSGLIRFYDFFNRYIGEDYIKFDALTVLLGSYQPDQFHNQKFYLNPSSARFETIAWDLSPFLDEYIDLDLNYFNNPLIFKMHLIPEFVHKRNKLVYDYMSGELSEENLINIVDEWEKKIEYEMKCDKFKDAMKRPNTLTMSGWRRAVDDLRENIKKRYKFLRDSLDNVDVKVYVVNDKIVFDVSGESAVMYGDVLLYPGRNYGEIDWMDIFENKLEYSSLRYEFEDVDVSGIKLFNSITGGEVIPEVIYLDELLELESDSLHPWKVEKVEGGEVVFDKDIFLDEDLLVGLRDRLIIRPGVNVKLGDGVSIISYGQIIAEGTKNNPIVFDGDFGSIVMQGLDGNSEINMFKYCVFDGGSGAEFEHVKYTGQVSVYNSVAYFENCKFLNNKVEDDNLNAKNSYVEIINSEFDGSFGDAIDFDLSSGKIVGSVVKNSGNDCIDLMGSDILVESNEMIGCGDKGVSVGEKSDALILNNEIINSDIGIAIKDMSEPIVSGNLIESNNIGISAYHKNWHYESGGRGKIYKNVLDSNVKDYDIDEESNLTMIDEVYDNGLL